MVACYIQQISVYNKVWGRGRNHSDRSPVLPHDNGYDSPPTNPRRYQLLNRGENLASTTNR
jgi:hypothetical protein